MYRFKAKEISKGTWAAVDTKDNDEPIIGDNLPSTEKEARTHARVANAALRICNHEWMSSLNKYTLTRTNET